MSPFSFATFIKAWVSCGAGSRARGVLDELDGAHGAEAPHVADAIQVRAVLDLIAAVENDLADGVGAVAELSSSMTSSTAWAAAQATGLPA